MKALNVLLSIAISIVLFVLALEGGLRLVGFAPKDSINRFDSKLGWSKTPEARGEHDTSEFDVTFEVNEDGLRDDPLGSKRKLTGAWRAMALGDSFVLGYTVDREDLFVDHLEESARAAGKSNDVINAGTEGWSTDQEVLWFLENGAEYEPDVVLIFPYENDLYWNGQQAYGRYPKPRFNADGSIDDAHLVDPGEKPWFERYAIGMPLKPFLAKAPEGRTWSPDGSATFSGPRMEWASYFEESPDFIQDAKARTRAALAALRDKCAEIGADVFVAPIPNKACVDADALAALESAVGVPADLWSPDEPVETFLSIARELGMKTLDARPALRAAVVAGDALYFERDWHFNPMGNRVFAGFVHSSLAAAGAFPEGAAGIAPLASDDAKDGGGFPGWAKLFLALWLALGAGYCATYADESKPLAFLKVGGLLGVIFGIVIGGGRLLGSVPPQVSQIVLLLFILGILGFVLYKLGRRTGNDRGAVLRVS